MSDPQGAGLSQLLVETHDLEAARGFYGTLLGLPHLLARGAADGGAPKQIAKLGR
jgi:hypothetical protein